MKLPLVSMTVFYCLGIILAKLINFNFWLILVFGLTSLIVLIIFRNKNHIFTLFLFFCVLLLGTLCLKNSAILPKNHINNFVYYRDDSAYTLDGFIDSEPVLKNSCWWFTFCVRQIQVNKLKWRCTGEILVKMDFLQELNYGDNLKLIGKLSRQYRSGILIMRIKDFRQIIRQPANSGAKLIRSSIWLRLKMESVIRRHLEDLPAAIISAMVLGAKRGIPWLVNDYMVKAGTVHILVVSGFNVGIVAFIINLIFKIMRIKRKLRIILAVICLLIYCAITGATNPVVRATIMGATFLLAYFSKRTADMYNSLAMAALLILIIKPGQLFNIGFQLSFMSVLAIIYLYPRLENFFNLKNCRIKLWKFICQGCLVSFSAWCGTAGIIAFNFGMISPVTVLANLLIVPLATLITLCGFVLVLSGLICPQLAGLFSTPISLLVNLLLSINIAVIKLPFAYIPFDKAVRLW